MNDSLEKKIKELEKIIEIINKDNAFLRFENDNLLKQNKLQTAIVEKLQKRIENLAKLYSIINNNNDSSSLRDEISLLKDDNSPLKDDRSPSMDDSSSSKDDRSSSKDDRSSSKDDRSSSKDDSSSSKDDSSSSKDDRSSSKDDRSSSKDDRSSSKDDRSSSKDDRSSSKDDRSSSKDDRSSSKDDSSSLKNESILSKEVQKRIIKGNIDISFKKKYIVKVKERLTEEIYYFAIHGKVRYDSLLPAVKISLPTIMRDFQLLRKLKLIEHVGPREGGHYVLSEEGKKLTVQVNEKN